MSEKSFELLATSNQWNLMAKACKLALELKSNQWHGFVEVLPLKDADNVVLLRVIASISGAIDAYIQKNQSISNLITVDTGHDNSNARQINFYNTLIEWITLEAESNNSFKFSRDNILFLANACELMTRLMLGQWPELFKWLSVELNNDEDAIEKQLTPIMSRWFSLFPLNSFPINGFNSSHAVYSKDIHRDARTYWNLSKVMQQATKLQADSDACTEAFLLQHGDTALARVRNLYNQKSLI